MLNLENLSDQPLPFSSFKKSAFLYFRHNLVGFVKEGTFQKMFPRWTSLSVVHNVMLYFVIKTIKVTFLYIFDHLFCFI